MIKTADIIIEDSGYVKPDYNSSTETKFTDFSSATSTEKSTGEFRVDDVVRFRVTAINFGNSSNDQEIPNINNIYSSITSISKSPFKFSLTGYIKKPKKFSNTLPTSEEVANLEQIKNLALMSLSRGHKNLYYYDSDTTTREQFFSLYYLTQAFGRTDVTETAGTKRHLNIKIDSISLNESVATASMNINCTLLWEFD